MFSLNLSFNNSQCQGASPCEAQSSFCPSRGGGHHHHHGHVHHGHHHHCHAHGHFHGHPHHHHGGFGLPPGFGGPPCGGGPNRNTRVRTSVSRGRDRNGCFQTISRSGNGMNESLTERHGRNGHSQQLTRNGNGLQERIEQGCNQNGHYFKQSFQYTGAGNDDEVLCF